MSRPESSPVTSLQASPAFHLLAKPTGAVCNLDCTYCFFLSKEALYPGSRFRMTDETLEAYIEQLIDAPPEVTVAWQGSEPTLMGLDFSKRGRNEPLPVRQRPEVEAMSRRCGVMPRA